MITPERKAEIARANGAKSKGPVTPEGKERSSRNAITHGERAAALQLFVPPHSAVLANEDRQKFYRLMDAAVAAFRPQSEIEQSIVRQMVELQWKIDRNHAIETAIHNRELLRVANTLTPTAPELRDIEICVAVQEALTGNRTIAALRRDTSAANTQILQLQRRLQHLQKNWPAGDPPTNEPERTNTARPQLIVSNEPSLPAGSAELFRTLYGSPDPDPGELLEAA